MVLWSYDLPNIDQLCIPILAQIEDIFDPYEGHLFSKGVKILCSEKWQLIWKDDESLIIDDDDGGDDDTDQLPGVLPHHKLRYNQTVAHLKIHHRHHLLQHYHHQCQYSWGTKDFLSIASIITH